MAIVQEYFHQGASFLHRADPRFKILAATAFACTVAPDRSLAAPAWGLALGAACLILARLPLLLVAKRLVLVNAFTAFLWLVLPFSTPGAPVWTLGPLAATAEGLRLAACITLKTNAVLCVFIALVATSTVPALGHALHALRVPGKLCHLLLFTYRYVHVIGEEYQRLATAARMRGFTPRSNLHTWRTIGYMAAMVLVRSWDRAERVRQAMVLRGFSGRFHTLAPATASSGDRVFAACMLAALCGLFWIESGYPLP
ncbi:MAG: cobalt ECF transporter T component CbiQ [Desulfovibrionaceae bacterium]